jgi:hypothetical protein
MALVIRKEMPDPFCRSKPTSEHVCGIQPVVHFAVSQSTNQSKTLAFGEASKKG